MLQDVIRAAVQRILRDKILLGLVIVAILGMFVGMTASDDKGDAAKKETAQQGAQQQQQAEQQAEQPKNSASSLTPKLASDFVTWWIGSAMDYNAATAVQSHNQAFMWMTVDAAHAFQANFWNPALAQAVQTGRLVAAFQTTGVEAQAVNPDGSVVVGVSGTMVVQSNGQPMTQQFLASFLVRQEKDGLRVAGLDPRAGMFPGAM